MAVTVNGHYANAMAQAFQDIRAGMAADDDYVSYGHVRNVGGNQSAQSVFLISVNKIFC